MQQNLIFALHGFLGESLDWSQVRSELEAISQDKIGWVTPSLFAKNSSPVVCLNEAPIQLLKLYQKELQITGPRIFVGYSMGGRVGLHFLEQNAGLFDHFIFISAHPGLQTETEKNQRKSKDMEWSELITEAGWDQFLKVWNAQEVFKSDKKDPARKKDNFDMQKLKDSLDLWSLGQQNDMRNLLLKYQEKITWVVGSEDTKFLNLAKDLKQKKILLDFNRIFSGHRILFENPNLLANIIANKFSELQH